MGEQLSPMMNLYTAQPQHRPQKLETTEHGLKLKTSRAKASLSSFVCLRYFAIPTVRLKNYSCPPKMYSKIHRMITTQYKTNRRVIVS